MTGTTIKVLYFAQVAEHMGMREEAQVLEAPLPVAEWLKTLVARCPALAPASQLKVAINQAHVPHSAQIKPGDEVAVFNPVTGG